MPGSSALSIALVHHANQFMITDGYQNRAGISAITGDTDSESGLAKVLRTHLRYRIPINLHLSGTLLESLSWSCPFFFSQLKQLAELNLLELVGSSYGQNMMRFFSDEHNLRQLREQLLLYENLLEWKADRVKAFWVPERLWDTKALAPVLTNNSLQNGGYQHVIIDDRLLYPNTGNPSPRYIYDKAQTWDPESFLAYRIAGGQGLCALPISNNLRQNIPPRDAESLNRVKMQLQWLFDINQDYDGKLIAIYADDMEKAAGVGWDRNGPSQYESLLKWMSERHWLHTVKLSDWTYMHPPDMEKSIDPGAYVELVNEFEAGETYEKWYFDPRWTLYREYYTSSENRVRELEHQGADASLIDLASKALLAAAWQTAWHTPRSGAHGERDSDKGPSAWVRAIASHCRISAIIAEAAYWMKHKDLQALAYLADLDNDRQVELVLKNDNLFAVFSPPNGGRLVYLFSVDKPPGRLMIGNPVDDWNLLEGLHEYMDIPPNHPGGLSDVSYEHDRYAAHVLVAAGKECRVRLTNIEENSSAMGIEKTVKIEQGDNTMRVDYVLPESVPKISTEIGLSPDYLQLLRSGIRGLKEVSPITEVRGWSNGDAAIWVKLGSGANWESPRQAIYGHGFLLRVSGGRRFQIWIGVGPPN